MDCETLWDRVCQGQPVYTSAADRHSEGNYVNGYRHTYKTWTLDPDGYVIRAIEAELLTFNLAADTTRHQRTLEIRHDGQTVFKAVQDRGGMIKRFSGPDEMFRGTELLPEKPWQIETGEIPDLD